jgi:hypothetical protein
MVLWHSFVGHGSRDFKELLNLSLDLEAWR